MSGPTIICVTKLGSISISVLKYADPSTVIPDSRMIRSRFAPSAYGICLFDKVAAYRDDYVAIGRFVVTCQIRLCIRFVTQSLQRS